MTNNVFPPLAHELLASAYPETVVTLPHKLCEHPLLTLTSLVDLATSLPSDTVEYNLGKLPIGIDPKDVPAPTLSIAETIASIENNGSWMVIKFIENDARYKALLNETLEELKPIVQSRTGNMISLQGFIFVSSPNAVTPFHFDPEHNILLQIRGNKVMTVFPASDEIMIPPVSVCHQVSTIAHFFLPIFSSYHL